MTDQFRFIQQFPATRMRRNRRDEFTRRMVRETSLASDDLIYPVFVQEGTRARQPVPSMPGVERVSLDLLLPIAERCLELGVPCIALFPVIDPSLKTPDGAEAANPDGLVPRVVAELKHRFPELGVLTDVALDPYTSHGQDGVLDEDGYVVNERTVEILIRQALVQAQAGVDIVAPSDMMDGRIGRIRRELDQNGFESLPIMSYAAKYASAFYGPFREAAESAPLFGDRRSYQMDPANGDEALREVALDIDEGADIVMVKPALSYLDIIYRVRHEFDVPVAAYNVSGEFSMVKAAAERGWIDGPRVMMEILLSIKRAGAGIIITYDAVEAAKLLGKGWSQ